MDGGANRDRRARWARIAAVGVMAVLGVAAYRGLPTAAVSQDRDDRNPECPHDVRIRVHPDSTRPDSVVTITTISVAGPRTNVPEYHDCQKLLERRNDRYGPLVGIWAAQTVENPTLASASAELYNWGVRYDDLGIAPEFNCLYLSRDVPRPGWNAWMVNAGADEQRCTRPFEPQTGPIPGVTPLNVRVDTTTRDLPSAARWDWSSNPPTQYIGIRCGDDWCEVGPQSGFDRSRRHDPSVLAEAQQPPETPNGRGRITKLKGYYDEQRLAPTSGNMTAATTYFGTVFPDENLAAYTRADFAPGRWPRVAHVRFRGSNGGYATKLNFAPNRAVSQIYMCDGGPAACLPNTTLPGELYRPSVCTADTAHGEEVWTAMIVSRLGTTFHCVIRRAAPEGVPVPATARWRWRADDETVWARCVDGCCEVQPRP